jgi:hypothetical protein
MLAAGKISKRCQEISGPVIAARIVTNIHTAKICQRVSGCLDQPRAFAPGRSVYLRLVCGVFGQELSTVGLFHPSVCSASLIRFCQ